MGAWFFIIIGAVYAGSGASQTLGTLGSVNTLAGAFMAALAAALTIYWTVKISLPVSTSQAIVGSIIGWNFFAGKPTDISVLSKIVGTWIFCPILLDPFPLDIFQLVLVDITPLLYLLSFIFCGNRIQKRYQRIIPPLP